MLELIEDLGTRIEGKTCRRWAKYKCSFCKNVFDKRVSNANLIDNCGCQSSTRKGSIKHGMSGMKQLVYAHSDMKKRCNTTTHKSYHRYGGRGITYCKEWEDFKTFALWSIASGFKEGIGLSIDRENVDGNYEPSNCRWIPRGQNTSLASVVYTLEQVEDARLLFNQGYKGKYIEEATGIKAISLHSVLNHQRKWK